MKKLLRELLFLRKGEKRGLLFASLLLMFSVIFRLWVAYLPANEREADPAFLAAMDQLAKRIQKEEMEAGRQEEPAVVNESLLSLFEFDPNTLSSDSLSFLGLPREICRNIVRYREAGGRFRSKDDMRKIYGMTDKIFAQIYSSIKIVQAEAKTSVNSNSEVNNSNPEQGSSGMPFTEINSADSLTLLRLPLIGPVFASRIIKYRQLLGGFYKVEQLLEVYGMDSARYDVFKDFLNIDTLIINKIDLNLATYKGFRAHPYLSAEEAQLLIEFRKFQGKITDMKILLEQQILDDYTFKRMRPYLTVEAGKY